MNGFCSSFSNSAWLSMEEAGRYTYDRVALNVFLIPLRESEAIAGRFDEDVFENIVVGSIIDDDKVDMMFLSIYELLVDICNKCNRKISFKFESKTVFETGFTISRTSYGLQLDLN